MSIVLSLKLLDEVPVREKRKMPSKYDLALRKFIVSKKPAAMVKAPSVKQAGTIVSSFRRAIKDNGYPVRVEKRGMEIILVNQQNERTK